MTQDFSVAGVISQKKRDGSRYDPVGKLAGLGGFLGILAGIYGLLFNSTETMFQLYGETPSSGIIMLLLGAGLLLQSIGGKELRIKLGSGYSQVGLLGALIGLVYFPFLIVSSGWTIAQYETLVTLSAFLTAFFIIMWQMYAVVFTDSTNGWIGVLTSIMNGFFFPVLAIGTVYGELLIMLAFVMLILGQLLVLFYWWSPLDSIREYARSPDKAKFSFGLSGLLAFMVGGVAVFANALVTPYGELWYPFSAPFSWNYTLAFGFISALLFWVLQGPRLGKKELKAAEISDDLIHGGSKYFPAFLSAVGIVGAIQAATFLPGAIESWSLLIVWAASGTMFLVGAIYMGRTDVITGLPIVISAIMMSIHPAAITPFVVIPFILVIISQAFLMFETKVRGFTYYSQPVLSVIVTIVFSLVFLAFMLGAFGSGPAAIWPTNRWFNVALFAPEYSMAVQAATVLTLPIAALMIRNVAVVGFGQKQTGEAKDVISGLTMLFVFLVPIVAAAFKGVAHQALTAAAIMLALYMISFVLVLSLNLTLAGEVEDTGNPLEGMLLRMTAMFSLVFGAIIAIVVLGTFSSTSVTALETAAVITWLVILISGLEVLLTLGWIIAGVRLGMFKAGFKFRRAEDAIAQVEYTPVQ
ncbi:MAG: hypothetical protein ACFFED_09880 [Candidatus Thorarchaeota archaeon]